MADNKNDSPPEGIDEFLAMPISIPGTQGLDPSAAPQQFLGQVLDKTIGGDQQQTQDAIQPTSSPIDLIAGGLGSKLGSSLAADASGIVGNEIGSLGYNVKPAFTTMEAGEAEYAPGAVQKLEQKLGGKELSKEELLNKVDTLSSNGSKGITQNDLAIATQKANTPTPMAAQPGRRPRRMAEGGDVLPAAPGTVTEPNVASPGSDQRSSSIAGAPPPPGIDEFLASSSLPTNSEPEGLDDFLGSAMQDHYGSSSQQALTAIESVGQGVVGPLAPAFEKHVLGINPEEIRARQEANPGTHMLGEGAGLVGSLVTGVGEGALAAKAGLKGLEALGLASGVAKIGSAAAEVSNVAKIGSAATKAAIENMVIQSSDEVSKNILNDPHQSAQTAMTDIGLAGLLGGALGSAGPLWNATIGKKVHGALDAISTKLGGIEGITDDAVNQGLHKLGLDVPPEVRAGLSNDPQLQSMFQHLQDVEGRSADKAKEALRNFKISTNHALLDSIGVAPEAIKKLPELSEYEAGEHVKKALSTELKSLVDPISSDFEKVKSKFKDIDINDGTRGSIAQKITDLASEQGYNLSPSSDQSKIIQNVYKELPNLKTLEDVRKYASIIGDRTQNPELYRIGGQLKKIFRGVEDDMVDSALADKSPELLATHAGARAAYKDAMGVIDNLNDRLHVGKYAGPDSFIRALKEMSPEDIIRRLSPKGDAGVLGVLGQFPNASKALRDVHLNDLLKKASDKALPGELLDNNVFFTQLNKLSPEMRNFLIPAESSSKLDALKAIAEQLPGKSVYKPSSPAMDKILHGIPAGAGALAGMLVGHNSLAGAAIGHLAYTLGKDVPDAVRLALLKFIGTSKPISAEGFHTAVNMMQSVIKGDALVNRATRNIFRSGRNVLPQYVEVSENDKNNLKKQLKKYRDDSSAIMKMSSGADHYAPEMASSVNQVAATAINYLNGIRPDVGPKSPLDSPTLTASSTRKAEYDQALTIAQQPLSVLQKVQKGTVTQKDVTALNAMYPNLYGKLKQKVMDEMLNTVHKGEIIPYSTRLGLSVFLGQPLDSTLSPQSIVSAQLVQQGQKQQPGTNQNEGMTKVKHSTAPLSKYAGNYMTSSQALEKRKLKD